MKNLSQYFFGGFLFGFILFFCVSIFFRPFEESILVATIAGTIYGLFCVGFRKWPFGSFKSIYGRKWRSGEGR